MVTSAPMLKGNRKPVLDTLPMVNRADMSTGRGTSLYFPETCNHTITRIILAFAPIVSATHQSAAM